MSAEEPRTEAIDQYGLADLPPDPALDDIARLAAQLCGTSIAGITVVEAERTSLIGSYGLDHNHLRPGTLPCETVLDADCTYQIPDTRQDVDLAPTGLLLDGRCYRFYAGAPVQTPGGVAVGVLFVLDPAPRELSTAQAESLEALSHAVTTRLELMARVRETHRASHARQRVEAALTVEKTFGAAVLDTVGALVLVLDPQGIIVRLNRACEIISGYRAAELSGRPFWDRLIPAEDRTASIAGFEHMLLGQFPVAFENQWDAADGTRRRISWSATALLDSQNQVAFLIATGLDVTVQRAAEQKIRESEARYREIVEGSLGLVCTHDLDGRMLSINEHGAESLGRTVDEVIGLSLTDFVYPERQHRIKPYLDSLLSTGEAQGLMHLAHRNGETRVIAYRNRLVRPAHSQPYVLGFGVDITEQMRAEERLRSVVRQSNSVLESVGDGIYGTDLDGNVTVVNPAAAQILGYTPEELLGRNMHAMVHHSRADGTPYPEEECPIRGSLQNLATVRITNEVFWHKDGRAIPVEYVARPQIESPELPDGGMASEGSPHAVGVVVAFTDISERNALDRMKDEFISTVSHELRTPLTSLRAALGLIAGGPLDNRPEKARQMMEIAIGNTDRLVRLVNDVLDLERIGSGKAEMHFVTCSMEEIFRRSISLLHGQASKARIRFVVQASGVTAWADPDRLLQTVTNLLSNAIHSSQMAGDQPNEVHLAASFTSPEEALIEVTDHGTGIPADKLEEIFERFKQLDASDSRTLGGTGLGLTICRSIVAQHGGRIWATSIVGQGSTFHFTLPTQPRRRLR